MDQQPLSRKSSRLEEEPELTIEKIKVYLSMFGSTFFKGGKGGK